MSNKPKKYHVSIDMLQNAILNALVHPLAVDPAAPADFQIWANSVDERIKFKLPGSTKQIAWLDDVTSAALTGAVFNANTILKADADDTPVPLTITPSTVVGRNAAGGIAALTGANLRTIMSIPTGNIATEAFATQAVADVIDASPAALNTLNELAAALGDDPNFATSINAAIAARVKRFAADIGDAAANTFVLAHGFGDADVVVRVYEKASGDAVQVGESSDATNTTIDFATPPAANAYRAVVMGI